MNEITMTRYSDADLQIFENLISDKLNKAHQQLENLQGQVIEMEESVEDSAGSHYMNDGGVTDQLEFLNGMIYRQRKHISDLEKALMRIKNRTYGRCIVTGELIDKNRLLAVPTTTKSLLAKTQVSPKREPAVKSKSKSGKAAQPRVYSRVVRKSNSNALANQVVDESSSFVDINFEDDDDGEETYFDTVSETLV